MMEPQRQRKKLWWAIAASILVHLLVAFSLVAFNTAFAPPVVVEDDKPVELTVLDMSSESAPPPPANPQYIETDPANESAEAPKEKTFESSANTIAASNAPASGDLPLPSQQGKDRPALEFDTHASSLPMEGARPPESTPEPVAPPATATPAPTQAPKPKPTPTPQITPLPEPSATPSTDQLAMLTGTPPPPIRDPQETEATPPPETAPTAPAVEPRPLPQRPSSAYRAEKQQTKIAGSITDRGNTSVNAVGTPLGKYQKQVFDAIGARWYYYTKASMDLISIGTARVTAEVDSNGKVTRLRVLSNNANEAFANVCLQSFQEAQIPPIPPDLVGALPGGRLPVEVSFTMYPN